MSFQIFTIHHVFSFISSLPVYAFLLYTILKAAFELLDLNVTSQKQPPYEYGLKAVPLILYSVVLTIFSGKAAACFG